MCSTVWDKNMAVLLYKYAKRAAVFSFTAIYRSEMAILLHKYAKSDIYKKCGCFFMQSTVLDKKWPFHYIDMQQVRLFFPAQHYTRQKMAILLYEYAKSVAIFHALHCTEQKNGQFTI